MGKIAILLCLVLIGCVVNAPVLEWSIPIVGDSVETILAWIAANISYKTDAEQYGVPGYWATPLETYSLRAGECEDFCTLALYLISRDAGIDGCLVIGTNENGVHAWIRINGIDWEPRTGRLAQPDVFDEAQVLTYEEAMETIGLGARVIIARIENADPF